jgi:hypothetical protein
MEHAVRKDAFRLALTAGVAPALRSSAPSELRPLLRQSDEDLDAALVSVLVQRVPLSFVALTPSEMDRLFERACFHGVAALAF